MLFENVEGFAMPVLVNLFGTVERVAWGMDREPHQLRELGETLAFFRQPQPPESFGAALEMLPLVKAALAMKPQDRGPRRPARRSCCAATTSISAGCRSRPAGRASRRR